MHDATDGLYPGLATPNPRRLPKEHCPVMKREPRPSKYQQAMDRKNAKYDWYMATADPDETWFRHHNWQAQRDQVRKALVLTHANEFQLNRFDECGSQCVVEWSDSEDRYRMRANYCHCRHCAPCAKSKGTLLSKNLQAKLEAGPADGNRFRFITLTLKHTPDDNFRPLLNKLMNCYQQLRKTEVWKKQTDGGCVVLETKWSKGGGWHPHVHIIQEGGIIEIDWLKSMWSKITGGSFKADIRELKSVKDVCYYVAKYCGKGVNAEMWADTEAAAEYIIGMKGVRFCATFGKWRGLALLKPDRAHEAKDWRAVGLLTQIASRARAGSEVDIQLLLTLDEALTYNPSKKRNGSKRNQNSS